MNSPAGAREVSAKRDMKAFTWNPHRTRLTAEASPYAAARVMTTLSSGGLATAQTALDSAVRQPEEPAAVAFVNTSLASLVELMLRSDGLDADEEELKILCDCLATASRLASNTGHA